MSEHERRLFLVVAFFKKHSHRFKILLIFLSVAIPLALLYYLYAPSFDKTFNGRAYYLFFVWLVVLEFVLDWDKYGSKASNNSFKNTLAFGLALTLPTCYVIAANFFGFNAVIIELFRPLGVISPWLDNTPLAMEFLAFTVLFAVIILFAYKRKGLVDFSLSIGLLGAVGAIHLINILYPYGGFTPFQIIVPVTATLSAGVLNLLGYSTLLLQNPHNYTPTLYASKLGSSWGGEIAWPCAGVDSLLIYTIVILLFLRKADIPRVQKIIYFTIGAVVTYFINILRIVSIFIIGINKGEVWVFHDYWAQLYSTTWIVSYLLIIIGSRILWSKLKSSSRKEAMVQLKPSGTDKASV
jgi:exosortase/archaeosortase family protein